ncbi:hypothetical protein AB9D46_28195, partial [Burkholderia multivorans]
EHIAVLAQERPAVRIRHDRTPHPVFFGPMVRAILAKQSDERHVYKGRREMLEIAKACSHW